MKKTLLFMAILTSFVVISCQASKQNKVKKVAMLIETSGVDESWEARGYQGMLDINEQFNIDIYLEENINSEQAVMHAVDELVSKGVTIIFGHGNFYGKYFIKIADSYPDIHFVYFNGGYSADNVTSLNFNSHAMGFFSGMIASEVSLTDEIGILAAHEWQPEIEGFYEGIKFENPTSNVHINFINDWNKQEKIFDLYNEMIEADIDVIYPTGELFSEQILTQAVKDNIFGIGYGMDQSYIDSEKILTSTIQHVDRLYVKVIERAMNQTLEGGIFYFDFQDDVISLGPFSSEISPDFQEKVNEAIKVYQKTNLLPNEQ